MSGPDTDAAAARPDDDDADTSPQVVGVRAVEIVVYLALLALAGLLAWDNVRSGAGWASDGPQAGYLPFYLCVILAGAALFGLAQQLFAQRGYARTFVRRQQLRRVLQVFVPAALFCAAMQWLGLYVASFLLVAGFMRYVGRIAWWKSIVTALAFSGAMYVTFDVAFNVLMPKGPLEALLQG
jgi:hypothetical protein